MPKFEPSKNPEHLEVFFDDSGIDLILREDEKILTKLIALNTKKDLDFNYWDGNFNSALYLAAANNKFKTVKYLVENGANPAMPVSDGLTPVHIAAHLGNIESLAILLNVPLGYMNTRKQDNFGETPLYRAIGNAPRSKLVETLKLLLKRDSSSVNIANEDGTLPLNLALLFPNADVVKLLINNGANISDQIITEATDQLFQNAQKVDSKVWFLDKSEVRNNESLKCAKIILDYLQLVNEPSSLQLR